MDSSLKFEPDNESVAFNHLKSLAQDELRHIWIRIYGTPPPACLKGDLLLRAVSYAMQERTFGRIDAKSEKLLKTYDQGGAKVSKPVKSGSVIVREYQGVIHDVVIVPDGFLWRGEVYKSLSVIARKITGTNWNGPRFFGLNKKAGKGDR